MSSMVKVVVSLWATIHFNPSSMNGSLVLSSEIGRISVTVAAPTKGGRIAEA
jgi:hypothetical protein